MSGISQRRGTQDAALGATLDFMRRLWALEHALQAASKRMAATLAVTGPQRVALRVIGRRPGMSAKALAHTLQLHPSTVTGVLARLEARGLIRRQTDPADGRGVRLFMAAKGKALTRSAAGTVEAAVQRALKQIDSRDLVAALRVLSTLTDALDSQRAEGN
jgi:DNA-binding MarR family transcriptional regulator